MSSGLHGDRLVPQSVFLKPHDTEGSPQGFWSLDMEGDHHRAICQEPCQAWEAATGGLLRTSNEPMPGYTSPRLHSAIGFLPPTRQSCCLQLPHTLWSIFRLRRPGVRTTILALPPGCWYAGQLGVLC